MLRFAAAQPLHMRAQLRCHLDIGSILGIAFECVYSAWTVYGDGHTCATPEAAQPTTYGWWGRKPRFSHTSPTPLRHVDYVYILTSQGPEIPKSMQKQRGETKATERCSREATRARNMIYVSVEPS